MKVTKNNLKHLRPRLLYANRCVGNGETEKKKIANAEIVLICKGYGKIEINGSEYALKEHDLIILNGGCEHREIFEYPEYDMLRVGFDNLLLRGQAPNSLLKNDDYYIINTKKDFSVLEFYMTQLAKETEREDSVNPIAENLAKIAVFYAMRLLSADGNVTFKDSCAFAQIQNYFDEHFTEIENLDSACKTLGVDKFYTSHLFTNKLGVPPLKYIINKRIELACEYLETTDDNMSDIGLRCGYNKPAYFSRIFKKVKGVTPLHYRYLFKIEKAEKEKEEASR